MAKSKKTKQSNSVDVEVKQEVKHETVKTNEIDGKMPLKPKRQPTLFAIFVKENYSKVKDLPNAERLKKLSVMYKESKNNTSQ